jgi:AraC family transcriptional regulator
MNRPVKIAKSANSKNLTASPAFVNTTLYTSDFFRIINYQCDSVQSFTSNAELSNFFSIGFTRTGNFHFKSFRQSADMYNSRILVEKPECEYRLMHTGDTHNATTFFILSDTFYNALKTTYAQMPHSFFSNADLLSVVLRATPELEYLHYEIWQKIHKAEIINLEIDTLVIELVGFVAQALSGTIVDPGADQRVNTTHLAIIENAKAYILENFVQNVTLEALSKHCCVSPFHFSRTFKQFNAFSPYNYLQTVRLKHAEMLLKTTSLSVTDICYRSGFNSLDYFSAAFTKRFKLPPSRFRLMSA